MDSSELYKKAFAAQFEEKDALKAISYYEKILEMFPNSYEAPMARQQIAVLRGATVGTTPVAAGKQTQPPKQPTQQRNPVDLLEKQVQILEDLRRQQLVQHAQIEQLRSGQNDLTKETIYIAQVLKTSKSEQRVTIADFNMPFWSLVGIIIKISLAAIPAYLIVGIFALIPLLILFSSCSAFTRGIR